MDNIVNVEDVAEVGYQEGESWQCFDRVLVVKPEREGRLGVVWARVPPGKSACPFHTHQVEDEVFFVLSGRGVFRYGERVTEIRAGDCISCPAGTGIGHQLANPFEEDLIYLGIGTDDPNEVCTYPDSGMISVRSLGRRGLLADAPYYHGQPEPPRIMTMRREG